MGWKHHASETPTLTVIENPVCRNICHIYSVHRSSCQEHIVFLWTVIHLKMNDFQIGVFFSISNSVWQLLLLGKLSLCPGIKVLYL